MKIVNFIKSRALNSRLFTVLCEEMGSIHTHLLLHTAVRWLSRGKVFVRIFEMRQEVHIFLDSQKHEYSENFVDFDWLSKLAYLADIFSHINDLNLMMQGNYFFLILFYFSNIKKEHILTIKAAIQTFFEYFKK